MTGQRSSSRRRADTSRGAEQWSTWASGSASSEAAHSYLAAIADDCPRGCSHLVEEDYCELSVAAADGRLAPRRVESMQRLLGTLVAIREQRHQE